MRHCIKKLSLYVIYNSLVHTAMTNGLVLSSASGLLKIIYLRKEDADTFLENKLGYDPTARTKLRTASAIFAIILVSSPWLMGYIPLGYYNLQDKKKKE